MKQKMAQILILLQSFSDVHKQQSKERFEVGKQEKSKAAYAPKATIPSQENLAREIMKPPAWQTF